MNWDALGAVAELLGALGVVASFVYLAAQIRQNTEQISQSVKSQRIATFQAIQGSGHSVRAQIVSESATYLKGLRDPSSLDPEDRLKFNMIITGVIMNLREIWLMHQWGTLDQEFWALQEGLIRWLNSQPGGRRALEPFLDDSPKDDPTQFASELRRIVGGRPPAV